MITAIMIFAVIAIIVAVAQSIADVGTANKNKGKMVRNAITNQEAKVITENSADYYVEVEGKKVNWRKDICIFID